MEASGYNQPVERPVPEGPIHPGSGRGVDWRKLFAPLGALALIIFKFGAKLKVLLFLLPKIKVFTTSALRTSASRARRADRRPGTPRERSSALPTGRGRTDSSA